MTTNSNLGKNQILNFRVNSQVLFVQRRTAVEAAIAKSQGIHILTVGIGDWVDKYELYSIASHPYQSNAIEVPSFDQLGSFSQRIKDIICNSKYSLIWLVDGLNSCWLVG